MNETDLNRDNIFIAKVRGKENSKTIQIPDSICEFCEINLGDLIKLNIIEIKHPKKVKGKKSKIPGSFSSTQSVERKKK